jgi:hypothetical protein
VTKKLYVRNRLSNLTSLDLWHAPWTESDLEQRLAALPADQVDDKIEFLQSLSSAEESRDNGLHRKAERLAYLHAAVLSALVSSTIWVPLLELDWTQWSGGVLAGLLTMIGLSTLAGLVFCFRGILLRNAYIWDPVLVFEPAVSWKARVAAHMVDALKMNYIETEQLVAFIKAARFWLIFSFGLAILAGIAFAFARNLVPFESISYPVIGGVSAGCLVALVLLALSWPHRVVTGDE